MSLDQVYRLEANQLDVRCVSLRFGSPSDVWFLLTVSGGEFDLPVGMDGVPRYRLRIQGDFAADAQSVSLLFTDPAGYFPAQIVPGSAVSSCK